MVTYEIIVRVECIGLRLSPGSVCLLCAFVILLNSVSLRAGTEAVPDVDRK